MKDLSLSWQSGVALCSLFHRFRPDLIECAGLREEERERNFTLAFDVGEAVGIPRIAIPTKEEEGGGREGGRGGGEMAMYLARIFWKFQDSCEFRKVIEDCDGYVRREGVRHLNAIHSIGVVWDSASTRCVRACVLVCVCESARAYVHILSYISRSLSSPAHLMYSVRLHIHQSPWT